MKNFRWVFVVICTMICFAGMCVAEEQYQVSGDYSYTIKEDGTAKIVYYSGNEANLVVPNQLNGYDVTEIGNYVFSYDELKKVTVSEGITTLGLDAFNYCYNLEEIYLPVSLIEADSSFDKLNDLNRIIVEMGNPVYYTEEGVLFNQLEKSVVLCPAKLNIETYSIPEGTSRIEGGAFALCTKLKHIEIPSTVTSIGSSAFSGCQGLSVVNIPEGVLSLGGGCFNHCEGLKEIHLPSSLNFINCNPFEGCYQLDTINISPNNASFVFENGCLYDINKEYLFACLPMLCGEKVSIPEGVKWLRVGAFSNCGMKFVDLPKSLERIGGSAFYCCENLERIYIPENVLEIEGDAFLDCDNMEAIEVAPNHASLSSIDGVLFNKDGKNLVWYPNGRKDENYIIPEGVEEIQHHAFDNYYLKKIVFSNEVKTIDATAFNGCWNLEDVVLNPGLETIYSHAFFGCGQIFAIDIPDSVTTMDQGVFGGCSDRLTLTIGRGTAAEQYAIREHISFVYRGEEPPLAIGSKGDVVRKLQQRLIDLGYLNGDADGDYGKMTAAAVTAFQKEEGLQVTGTADAVTQERLYSKE